MHKLNNLDEVYKHNSETAYFASFLILKVISYKIMQKCVILQITLRSAIFHGLQWSVFFHKYIFFYFRHSDALKCQQ